MNNFSFLVGPTGGGVECEEERENEGANESKGHTTDVKRCPHLHFM